MKYTPAGPLETREVSRPGSHKSSAHLFTKQTVKAGSNYIGVSCQVRSGAQAHRRALLTSPGLHRPMLTSSVWGSGSSKNLL